MRSGNERDNGRRLASQYIFLDFIRIYKKLCDKKILWADKTKENIFKFNMKVYV